LLATSQLLICISARAAGWDATVLSDMLTVGYYFGTSSFDATRSIAVRGASIAPLSMPSLDDLVNQVRQQTGLNVEFATMCLESNQWNLALALSNFAELKVGILDLLCSLLLMLLSHKSLRTLSCRDR
jgi:hypothetical protein